MVDVAGELSRQFEENVGDDIIHEVETDAEIREDEPAATPAPYADTNACDADSGVSLKDEAWKTYEEGDLDYLYEDVDEELEKELP